LFTSFARSPLRPLRLQRKDINVRRIRCTTIRTAVDHRLRVNYNGYGKNVNPRGIKDLEEKERKQGGRLAIFLFLATLLGSLLGAAADLSEADGLFLPIVERLDPGPQLHISGSDTVLGDRVDVATEWKQEFIRMAQTVVRVPILGSIERSPHIDIETTDYLTSFESAREGGASLLIVTEPMTEMTQEKMEEGGITTRCAAVIGFDVIAFVTYLDNEGPPLSRQDISNILTGQITDWSKLGWPTHPINVLADPASGATDIVLQKLTGSKEFRSHFIKCTSNVKCLDMALATPGSFYGVSASWLKDQPARYLNSIAIENGTHPPQDPLQDNFNPDWYPKDLIRPLYIYAFSGNPVASSSADLATEFVQFVRGARGQEILEENDFYTYFHPPIHVTPELPPGFGPRSNDTPVVCKQIDGF